MVKGVKELILEQGEVPPRKKHDKEENALEIVLRKRFLTIGNYIVERPIIPSH